MSIFYYYIIPPIITIAAAAFLVYFVLKKISTMPVEHQSFFQKQGEADSQAKKDRVRKKLFDLALKILEKIVQRFKLYSLKFHNCCQNWFQSIKRKKEEHNLNSAEPLSVSSSSQKLESKAFSENLFSRSKNFSFQKESKSNVNVKISRRIEEVKIEPMVKKEAVFPEIKNNSENPENRLEEILIERIVINPSDVEAYERLGDYYLEQGNYEESLECFKYVLKLSPVHHKAKVRVRRLEKMLGELG